MLVDASSQIVKLKKPKTNKILKESFVVEGTFTSRGTKSEL